MKTFAKNKGFTLVELMIVIGIIGVLSAVLYPSFSGYLESARDKARTEGIRAIKTSLLRYASDYSKYPGNKSTKCVGEIDLSEYESKKIKDPKGNYGIKGCERNGGYAYKALKINTKETDDAIGSAFAIGAKMEQWSNSNFDGDDWDKINTLKEIKLFDKEKAKDLKGEPHRTYFVEHS